MIGLPGSMRACGFIGARIDGLAEREGLKGKPAPDTFLAGVWTLGVEAGRVGAPACGGQAEALREHGASIVVSDLSELLENR